MNKLHLLGANRSYDRDEQTVSVNQVVVLEGYSYDSYVVYEVNRSQWGITYHLINLRTYEFHTSDLIRPLSEKFGIGISLVCKSFKEKIKCLTKSIKLFA